MLNGFIDRVTSANSLTQDTSCHAPDGVDQELWSVLTKHVSVLQGSGTTWLSGEGKNRSDRSSYESSQMPLSPRTPLLRSPRVVIASGMHGTGVTTIAEHMQLATTTLHIVDGGAQWADIFEACMPGFVRLIAVTTNDIISISSTYALITTICDRFPGAHIEVLVNQSEAHEAVNTYERLHDVASHCLGATIGYVGAIPDDRGATDRLDASRTASHNGSRTGRPTRPSVGRNVVAAIHDVATRLDKELGWTRSQPALCMTDRRTIR